MLLIEHHCQLLLVFLRYDVAFNILSCDRCFFRVLRKPLGELLFGDLAVSVLVECSVNDSLQLLIHVHMDNIQHCEEFRIRKVLVLICVKSIVKLIDRVLLLIHIGRYVNQGLLLNSFLHCGTIVDAEHNLSYFLFLDFTLHVGEPCDSIHSDVVCCRGIMSFKHSVELGLVNVLVHISVLFQFHAKISFAHRFNLLD